MTGMKSSAKKFLIVNADDFGLSEGTNRGIVRAHEHGVVTSVSLMVRQPAAAAAAAYARRNARLSVGLHLDVGEWAYRDGRWLAVYEVVPAEDGAAVAAEARRQLAVFRDLTGRDPTHLDSHQHAHRFPPLAGVAEELAQEIGVPLRHVGGRVAYRGDFYGQDGKGFPLPEAITPGALVALVRSLPAGVTELACHPGEDDGLDSTYRLERLSETRALCDPSVKAALAAEGVELVCFARLPTE